ATSKDPAALFPLLQGSPPLQQLSESLGIDLAGASIEGLSEDEIRAEAKGLSDALRNNSLRGQGIPAGLRTFNEMTRGLPTSDQQKARRIHLGLDPRAGMSAQERIALSPDLTDLVADSQSQIREATKFAEATGASRSKFIDTGFDTIEKTEKNIRNLSRARAALDAGASTGAIEAKYFPTIRESTIQLEHVQGELGLDIVGAVTFGQLSEKELELAKDVALPTGLQPPALMTWLQEKEAAQQKLVDYYSEQIDFLDQGGSIAGFLREKGRQSGGAEAGFTTDEGGADSTDNDARFQSVWDAAQSGDVLVAPDGTLRRKP
ncbi:MAG: hypothetical protein GY938_04990, partial [Ketobacter sp.]|nr:hypothetical protein [Ketobacter sp.]